MTARRSLAADLRRYFVYLGERDTWPRRLAMVLATEGIWALTFYRLGQYLDREAARPVRAALSLPFAVVYKLVQIVTGIHISVRARIGPGLYIGHCGGIWVSPHVALGADCTISHESTIGVAGRAGRPQGRAQKGPTLGDRVWVGPNSSISGPVRVGSGAVIGANSLVVSNIPDNGVAVGVPARVLSYTGSAHLLQLPREASVQRAAPAQPEPVEKEGAPA